MQAVILFASVLAVSSAGIVSFVPVSYIASPHPIYNQAQNTRTGEYAYSYAGGPSAKEEVKTLDGVTRGAYSYVDANGIVQSAEYVADDNGFRVAATNIPTDAHVGVNVPFETPEVQAAKAAHFAEHAKAIAALGRRKRSLAYSSFPTAVSSQYHDQKHESVKVETPVYAQQYAAVPLRYAGYEHVPVVAPVAVSSVPTGVSHQSRHQVHETSKLEVSAPVYAHTVEAVGTVPEHAVNLYDAVEVKAVQPVHVAVSSVPTAVSNQRRFQVHNDQKLEVHAPLYAQGLAPVAVQEDVVNVDTLRSAPVVLNNVHATPVAVSSVPTAVSSQSRHQVHNNQKLEVHTPLYAQAFAPVAVHDDTVTVDTLRSAPVAVSSVPTAVSSQTKTQVHNSAKLEVRTPVFAAPGVAAYSNAHLVNSYGHPVFGVAAVEAFPTGVSSQSRSQVHSSEELHVSAPVHASTYHTGLPQGPQDTPEVAAAKQAHAEAYAAEVAKHHGW